MNNNLMYLDHSGKLTLDCLQTDQKLFFYAPFNAAFLTVIHIREAETEGCLLRNTEATQVTSNQLLVMARVGVDVKNRTKKQQKEDRGEGIHGKRPRARGTSFSAAFHQSKDWECRLKKSLPSDTGHFLSPPNRPHAAEEGFSVNPFGEGERRYADSEDSTDSRGDFC